MRVLRARARFHDERRLEMEGDAVPARLDFERAILATGSVPAAPAALRSDDPRVMDSTSALALEEVVDVFERDGATPATLETGEPVSALAHEILDRAAAAAADVTGAISLAGAVGRVVERRDDTGRAGAEEARARALHGASGPPRA